MQCPRLNFHPEAIYPCSRYLATWDEPPANLIWARTMLVLVSSRLPLRPNTRPYTIDCKAYTLIITMATKRIIRELEAYNRDPSPVLSRLEPISDDNLLELTATLLGPEGTAYEGIHTLSPEKKKEKKERRNSKPPSLSTTPAKKTSKKFKAENGTSTSTSPPPTPPTHPPSTSRPPSATPTSNSPQEKFVSTYSLTIGLLPRMEL